MEDEREEREERRLDRLDILDDIRKTEAPGRRGGASPYAQAVYGYFPEIQELQSEGFTMATICKYFERKGTLPSGADVHSFRQAFRREDARRHRAAKSKGGKKKNVLEKKEPAVAEKIITPEFGDDAKQVARMPQKVPSPLETGVRINPADNTFAIPRTDPAILAAIEKIKN